MSIMISLIISLRMQSSLLIKIPHTFWNSIIFQCNPDYNSNFFGRNYHRSEEHTSELQSQSNLVCRLLLEKNIDRYWLIKSISSARLLQVWGSPDIPCFFAVNLSLLKCSASSTTIRSTPSCSQLAAC